MTDPAAAAAQPISAPMPDLVSASDRRRLLAAFATDARRLQATVRALVGLGDALPPATFMPLRDLLPHLAVAIAAAETPA